MKTIRIPKADREWLIREITYKLNMERSRQRYAMTSAQEQISENIAVQERLLEALTV